MAIDTWIKEQGLDSREQKEQKTYFIIVLGWRILDVGNWKIEKRQGKCDCDSSVTLNS